VPKEPFSLTLVHYDSGSVTGWLLALITLAPIFIIVAYAVMLMTLPPRATAELAVVFVGQLANVGFNLVLKRMFQLPRPPDLEHLRYLGRNGMPSNHSQFMGFIAVLLVVRSTKREKSPFFEIQKVPPWLLSGSMAILSLLVAYSRWHLEYHTPSQVLVGYAFGAFFGVLWSFLLEKLSTFWKSQTKNA